MSSNEPVEEDLAREIREAIRRAVPSAAAKAEDGPEGLPDSLRRAEEYLTPSVPEGARLSTLKRALLRATRFLWRDQAAFNTLALESFRRLRQDWDGRFAALAEATERDLAESRRRSAVSAARFADLETSGRRPPSAAMSAAMPTAAEPSAIPPAVYALFEERFRGSPERIAGAQRSYLRFLENVPGPVLDAGCGRGEFLRLLAEKGIAASGVDSNPISVRLCREAGLAAEEGDAVAALTTQPAESLGAVVAFQVVEHWPAGRIFEFLCAARRALADGGVLIAESVNTDSLSALRAFFLDPTHVRPVPPAALAFLAEAAGFADARVEYPAPLPPAERLVETSENDAKLNRLLFGPPDYAVIARVRRA